MKKANHPIVTPLIFFRLDTLPGLYLSVFPFTFCIDRHWIRFEVYKGPFDSWAWVHNWKKRGAELKPPGF